MKIQILATFMVLSSTVKSQNDSRCNAVYAPPRAYALDVCSENTMLGISIYEKYYCAENPQGVDQVYRGFWWSDDQCAANPDERTIILSTDSQETVCNGITNCPYATVAVYQSTLNCESKYWTNTRLIVDVCESTNSGSQKLECDQNDGITRKIYTGSNCDDGDLKNSTVLYPGNDTCIINIDGLAAKFTLCHTRSNATSPIPLPTPEPTAPTPKPTAGGSAAPTTAPTTPTTAPIADRDDADDTWFITALVFICLFGVMLCGMLYLGYMVFNDKPQTTTQYNRVDATEAGVEATPQT